MTTVDYKEDLSDMACRVLARAKSKGGGGIRGSHQYTTP